MLQFWRELNSRGSTVKRFEAECTKIAHRHSLAILTADSGIARNSAVGISFVPFNRRENRCSLAIFDRKKSRNLAGGGAVEIAAAATENRAILVHSSLQQFPVFRAPLVRCRKLLETMRTVKPLPFRVPSEHCQHQK